MTNATIFAKVNDDLTAVDTYGNDITDTIPLHSRKRANTNGTALKMIHTTTGKTQWRDADMSEYDALLAVAVPPKKVDNMKNELENDIVEFLKDCGKLKPSHLIMDSLKWRYLMRSVLRGKNVMMTGPSGCGKTLAAQTIASVLGTEPVTEQLSLEELEILRKQPGVIIVDVTAL